MKKGCLATIFAVLAVCVLAIIIIIVMRGRIAEYGVKVLEKRVVELLPPDVEQAKVKSAFRKFEDALREKRLKEGGAEEVRKAITQAFKDGKLTREEVEQILDKLQGAIKK